MCKKFEKQRKEKRKEVDQCNSCTLSTYLSSITFKHCILWLFVRAGENFPLIVVMLADTPWANASSSFVPQLGLLLCFSMFDALKWFCLKTIYFTYEWFLWKRLRNWLTKYVRQELKNKLWNISLWKRATRLVKATRFIHVMYHCPASNG